MTATRDHTRKAYQNKDRLKRLAAFAPIFRDPKTVFGEMIAPTGSGTPQDPLTFPWYKTSEVADSFIDMARMLPRVMGADVCIASEFKMPL
jgi:hypothetical protein